MRKWITNNIIPCSVIFLLALLYLSPLFHNISNRGAGDWDAYCFFDEIPRVTLQHYGQLPLWNPYSNGGKPLLAHPHITFLRPTYLFSFLFGCIVGLKIEMFIMLSIGMIGMLLLMRHYDASMFAGILSVAIFGLTSFFSLHITEGHVDFINFMLLPFIFLFFIKSLEDEKYLFVSSFFLAWSILSAPINHGFIQIALFVGLTGSFMSIKNRSLKPAFYFFLIVMMALSMSAIKLIPMIEYLNSHSRQIESDEMTTLAGLYHVLLDNHQFQGVKYFDQQKWKWHEYGAYVGFIPIIFFILGLCLFFKKEWPIVTTGFLMLVLSAGNFAKLSPWSLMHQLYVMSWVRVPSRFIILFVFVVAIIAGLSADNLLRSNDKRNKAINYCLIALVIFSSVDLALVGRRSLTQATLISSVNDTKFSESAVFHHFFDTDFSRSGAYSSMYLNLLENSGTLNAYDPIFHSVNAIGINDSKYNGEVYVLKQGTAKYEYWSPNKLVIKVKTVSNNTVVINQNYDSGWKANDGMNVENFNGLLAVPISTENEMVILHYLPRSFIYGSIISILSVLTCILFLIWTFFIKSKINRIKANL